MNTVPYTKEANGKYVQGYALTLIRNALHKSHIK